MTSDKTDFTQGNILKKLVPFMIPILGALVLQAAYGAESADDEQIDRAVGGLEYQRAQNRNHKRYQFL